MKKTLAILLLLASTGFAQTRIQDLNSTNASGVDDPTEVYFGVHHGGVPGSFKLPISELNKLGPIATVDDVADLASAAPRDGQLWQTRGYGAPGDGGANVYRYVAGSSATVDGGWVLNGPGGTGRYLALDRSVANVKQFGAKGDAATDDAAAVQAAVDAVYTSGGASAGGSELFFPAGRYNIGTTIDIGTLRGVKIRGVGAHTFDANPSGGFPQSLSVLVWVGAEDGTLFTGGMTAIHIEDMAFWGAPPGGATRAGIGIHHTAQLGVGAGTGFIENCSFCNFDIAYKAGTAIGDANCDNMTFNHVVFQECDIGFQANNSQSVNHNFLVLHTNEVARVFEFNGGGNLYVGYMTTVHVEEILQINGTGTAVGDSNGTFVFNQVMLDAQQLVTPTLVATEKVDYSGNRSVTFRGVRTLSTAFKNDGRYLIDVNGSIDIVVENMQHLPVNDTLINLDSSFTYDPMVLFRRCVIESTSIPAGWTSSPTFVTLTGTGGKWGFVDCMAKAATHLRFPGIGNHPALPTQRGPMLISNSNATTLDVSGYGHVRMINNSATTLSTLNGGVDHQMVIFTFETNNNTIDFTGTAMRGNQGVDWAAKNGDSMIAYRYNGVWYCTVSKNVP